MVTTNGHAEGRSGDGGGDRPDDAPGAAGAAGTADDARARAFAAERRRLVGLAYRMLGTLADAEDVVQDAWLRLGRVEPGTVDDLPAWLTTVTSRLALDRLRAVRRAREAYVGPWLPEPIVAGLADRRPGPADVVELDDSVRLALLVVLEQLTPEQRVAFVLHDVFAVPFAEVAATLGVSPAAARQLASRARRTVRDARPTPRASAEAERAAVLAFRRAALDGDVGGLVAVLAPGVVLRSDGGGAVSAALRPVVGAEKVARLLVGLLELAEGPLEVTDVLVNGEPGMVVRAVARGRPETTVVVPRVDEGGRVVAVDIVRNPAKLRGL